MEEKERYELKIYAGCEYYSITDTKEKQQITIENTINLLNQQDQRIAELQKQLERHNKYFKSFSCDSFDEFADFISTFMLTPHEEQTLIKDLEKQLEEKEKEIEQLKKFDDLNRNFFALFRTAFKEPDKVDDLFNTLKTIQEKHNQDKISFAVEQLEKVKKDIDCYMAIREGDLPSNIECLLLDFADKIDNQIKELTGVNYESNK